MIDLHRSAVDAIRAGDVETLEALLLEHPSLAKARPDRARTLLHVVADRPGHFPRGAETVAALARAGAEPDARFLGRHGETPLHWAASSGDMAVLDALLDAGADIEADGATIAGGTALTNARVFGNWAAARRLVERGAVPSLDDAAALGLVRRVTSALDAAPPQPEDLDRAFWYACHGGSRTTAELLLNRGADVDHRPSWEDATPLDAALRTGAADVAEWLRTRGARRAAELRP
ncbi:ankyrin repeat domain-containing protein [Pseudonocardia sp. T1-2H]|jgi:ankyrin repeat protein|uniref:ankyrin repeat domain-containing protein n=1 Tax=Pseudonocardia sp. T1-2H TaxID=3128899 RepID=UPI003100CDB3